MAPDQLDQESGNGPRKGQAEEEIPEAAIINSVAAAGCVKSALKADDQEVARLSSPIALLRDLDWRRMS